MAGPTYKAEAPGEKENQPTAEDGASKRCVLRRRLKVETWLVEGGVIEDDTGVGKKSGEEEKEEETGEDKSARARNGEGREFQRRGAETEKARD